jgi:hypothetical protein
MAEPQQSSQAWSFYPFMIFEKIKIIEMFILKFFVQTNFALQETILKNSNLFRLFILLTHFFLPDFIYF